MLKLCTYGNQDQTRQFLLKQRIQPDVILPKGFLAIKKDHRGLYIGCHYAKPPMQPEIIEVMKI